MWIIFQLPRDWHTVNLSVSTSTHGHTHVHKHLVYSHSADSCIQSDVWIVKIESTVRDKRSEVYSSIFWGSERSLCLLSTLQRTHTHLHTNILLLLSLFLSLESTQLLEWENPWNVRGSHGERLAPALFVSLLILYFLDALICNCCRLL